jgi:hypothetical protein
MAYNDLATSGDLKAYFGEHQVSRVALLERRLGGSGVPASPAQSDDLSLHSMRSGTNIREQTPGPSPPEPPATNSMDGAETSSSGGALPAPKRRKMQQQQQQLGGRAIKGSGGAAGTACAAEKSSPVSGAHRPSLSPFLANGERRGGGGGTPSSKPAAQHNKISRYFAQSGAGGGSDAATTDANPPAAAAIAAAATSAANPVLSQHNGGARRPSCATATKLFASEASLPEFSPAGQPPAPADRPPAAPPHHQQAAAAQQAERAERERRAEVERLRDENDALAAEVARGEAARAELEAKVMGLEHQLAEAGQQQVCERGGGGGLEGAQGGGTCTGAAF